MVSETCSRCRLLTEHQKRFWSAGPKLALAAAPIRMFHPRLALRLALLFITVAVTIEVVNIFKYITPLFTVDLSCAARQVLHPTVRLGAREVRRGVTLVD